jgi:hypothetical protein
MVHKYLCKKDISFGILLMTAVLLIIGLAYLTVLYGTDSFVVKVIISLIIVSVVGLFLWLWFGTYYVIYQEKLIAKSGPFKWRVSIHEINYVRLHQKTIGGTWKPTLSWNSIEIRDKESKSIFISPDRQTEFISDLINMNNHIIIKDK